MNYRKLKTIKQIAEESGLTEYQIRTWIFWSKENGFEKCMVRSGPKKWRILIDTEAMGEWLEQFRVSEQDEPLRVVR